MRIPHPFHNRPLLPATFVARPNRFIGEFTLPNDATVHRAHIADPGRLQELLVPGAQVWVVDYRDHPTRKLPFAMPYVRSAEGEMVSIFSRLPNWVVQHAIQHHGIAPLSHYTLARMEPSVVDPQTGEKSRLDMALISPNGDRCLVEVKGASLVENGICKFPDAPTVRGARQLHTLARLQKAGTTCHVVVVCQRSDAIAFMPHHDRDPEFASAFAACQAAGVGITVIAIGLTPEVITITGTLPVLEKA